MEAENFIPQEEESGNCDTIPSERSICKRGKTVVKTIINKINNFISLKVASALREMRRVEQEMLKRERMEEERKAREAVEAKEMQQSLEESERCALFKIYSLLIFKSNVLF